MNQRRRILSVGTVMGVATQARPASGSNPDALTKISNHGATKGVTYGARVTPKAAGRGGSKPSSASLNNKTAITHNSPVAANQPRPGLNLFHPLEVDRFLFSEITL